MTSLLTVLGVYIVSSWFSRDPSAYEPLSFLLPPAWWAEAAGKGMVLALVWVTINCRLRSESRDWGALGWRELSWGRLARESAWGVACAAAVVAIGELFLNQGPNPSNRDAVERLVPIIDSLGVGKYAVLALGTVLTGIIEELVYRGAFFAFLGRTFGKGRLGLAAYVVLSSLVFSGFHGLSAPRDYATYAVIGAVFAMTLAAAGSLRAVMLAHVLVNAFHLGTAIRLSFH